MIVRDSEIKHQVHQLLEKLRAKIRHYAWYQGSALVVTWIAAFFLLYVALDYLPAKLGGDELPHVSRLILLSGLLIGSLLVLYRWTFRRIWARISDRSAALLVERSYPRLQDRLMTVVELDGSESELGDQMLQVTRAGLVPQLAEIQLDPIFNFDPLRRAVLAMSVIVAMVIVLFGFAPKITFIASKRLFALSTELYPRETQLDAFEFTQGQAIAARGSDFIVRVRATAKGETPPPRSCAISYRTQDGQRGRVNMSRVGSVRDGFQQYVFDGNPFRGLLDDLEFDVFGGDAHLRDLKIKVVDSPSVTDIQLQCEFPAYTRLVPRTESYRPGIQLPYGSRVLFLFKANKLLQSAEIVEQSTAESADESEQIRTPEVHQDTIRYPVERLDGIVRFELNLKDTDGLASRRSQVVHVEPRADDPPKIDAWITGIGTAITSDAILPIQGTVQDDYGVAETWVDLQVADQNPLKSPAIVSAEGALDHRVDLRAMRQNEQSPLQVPEGVRLSVQAKALDEYALGNAPQIGEGDRFELEVVSPEKLLAMLEGRELSLRQRFEQIIQELKQSRDSLAQVVPSSSENQNPAQPSATPGSEPDDKAATAGEAPPDQRSMQLLRVQRVWQDVQRSSQEVEGVAFSFLDICNELDNNRIDAVERKRRLTDDIANPLQEVSRNQMPGLVRSLRDLEIVLGGKGQPAMPANAKKNPTDFTRECLGNLDDVVLRLEAVLGKMLDLESYNELVDLVRGIIQEQESLSEQTRKRQRENALELLKE